MEEINKNLPSDKLCPSCKSNHRLFIDNSTDVESRMCFNCGYMTSALYKTNSEKILEFEAHQPKIITALRIEDSELNQYWYPCVIHITSGMIFPEGSSIDDWGWSMAKVVSIPVFERINYPKPGSDGEFYDTKLDIDNAKHYHKLNFLDACKELGIVVNMEK